MAVLGLSFLFPRASPQDISFLALGIQDADDTILAMGTMSCKFLVSLARKAYGRCSGDTGLYTCFSIFQTRVTCRSRWRHTHTHPPGAHMPSTANTWVFPFSASTQSQRLLWCILSNLANLHRGFTQKACREGSFAPSVG